MRFFLSFGFFRPANIIFVPFMYFLGAARNSNRVFSPHTTPAPVRAEELEKEGCVPDFLPKTPCKFGRFHNKSNTCSYVCRLSIHTVILSYPYTRETNAASCLASVRCSSRIHTILCKSYPVYPISPTDYKVL